MKPELSLNKDYILKIINKNLNHWYPEAKKINSIKIKRIFTITPSDFIVKYSLNFTGKPSKIILRGSANKKGGDRLNAYKTNVYLWNYGFNQGKYLVNKPLSYFLEAGLFLYEEFPGKNLFELMSINSNNAKKLKKLLIETSNWLVKLHKLNIHEGKIHGLKEEKKIVNLSKKVFIKFNQYLPDSLNKIKIIWDKIIKKENFEKNKMILIHNDFFPGNIIINKNKLDAIDFIESKRFMPLVDIGSILAFLETPFSPLLKSNFSKKEIKKIEGVFIKNYCQKMKLSFEKTKGDLKIYKARAVIIMATNTAKLNLAYHKDYPNKKLKIKIVENLILQAMSYLNQ